jgi:hypothetical protein
MRTSRDFFLAWTSGQVKEFTMRTIQTLLAVATLLVVGFATAETAHAQALIRGTLLDERSDEPIEAGLISLLNDSRRIVVSDRTNDDGTFELRTGREGYFTLRSERQGYMPTTSAPLELIEGDTIDLEFRISPDVVFLAPITVTATARNWWQETESVVLWSFYERRDFYERLGSGRFLVREDLEPYDGMTVTQMLGTVAGLHLRSSENGVMYPTVRASNGLLRDCQPMYYVDGMPVPFRSPMEEDFDHGDTIDSIMNTSYLVGVEVYAGAAQVPGEFGGLNANCGVIALWTSRQG